MVCKTLSYDVRCGRQKREIGEAKQISARVQKDTTQIKIKNYKMLEINKLKNINKST